MFGPETLPHLQFLGNFAGSLENQSNKKFDVIFFATKNLQPRILQDFKTNAPAIIDAGRLKILDLPDRIHNHTAAKQRMDFFFQTVEGVAYDYIFFADGDDMLPPGYIETMLDKIRHYDAKILAADFHLVDNHGTPLGTPYLSRRFAEGQVIDAPTILDGNFLGLSNTLVHRDALQIGEYQRLADLPLTVQGAPDWPWIWVAAARGQENNNMKTVFTCEGDAHIKYRQMNGMNLSGITRPDVEKAFLLKTAIYNHFLACNGTSSYLKEVGARAAFFDNLQDKFGEASTGSAIFQDYRVRAAEYYARLQTPIWWESAPFLPD